MNDLVVSWANTNTPTATVVALGKHMMFWERPAEINQILDTFLQAVAHPAEGKASSALAAPDVDLS